MRPLGTKKRSGVVQFRVSQPEYDRLMALAAEAGVTLSEYARSRVFGESRPDEALRLLREISENVRRA